MQTLGKILKIALWLVLLILVLGLLTVLAWWMRWPLATGAVILLGLIAGLVLLVAIRFFLRWNNKKLFIRKVLSEQTSASLTLPASGGLADAWRQGMNIMVSSPARFHHALRYSQPWFLTLSCDDGPSLLRGTGKTVPAEEGAPLHWHFLRASVVLECAAPEGDSQDWASLLELAAGQRGGYPFQGIVLTISARRLQAADEDSLPARGMALASVCIAIVLATPLLLGTASADTGHMHPGPQRELDRSFAVARTTRCRTPAAALDTYAKGLLYDNGVFLTAASPFEKHEELYEGMRASGADGWVAYHYEAVPEQYSIDTGSGYLINNLVSTEDGCEAELVLTVSYVADLENGGWLKDADGDTIIGLYVIPVRAYEAEGWVVEETGERQFIAADAIVYDPVSLARWGNDVLPWRDTVSVERETGTVTLRRNIYAMASDSSVGLAGVPQGYSDSVYRPNAVFRTMAELFCVEYTCNEANFPRSVAKLEMLPLGSVDEAYAIDGTEYESSGWRNDSWDGKVYTMSEEFRYDAPLLPEPEFKAAAVRISLDGEVVDEFVMEGGAENGGA